MTVRDLVLYNHAVRDQYLDALSKLPWSKTVEPCGLSFDSARNVFLHLTLVEDRWVNYILPGRFSEWKDPDFEAYQTVDSLREYADRTKALTEAYLQALKPEDLQRKIALPWKNFPANSQVTVKTALIHMVMEDTVHYGELSAMFWQSGLEAPYLAYLRFKIAQETAL